MNIGCWTDGHEDWFLNRLWDIRHGNAKPLTSRAWREKLRKLRARQDTFLANIITRTDEALFSST